MKVSFYKWGKHDHILLDSGKGFRDNYHRLSKFPGTKKWRERVLQVRINGINMAYLCSQWEDKELEFTDERSQEEVKAYRAKGGEDEATQEAKEKPIELIKIDGMIFRRPPRPYQLQALAAANFREYFAYLMTQGAGKTKVVIDEACALYRKGSIDALVIVAWPIGVHLNWIDYELPEDCSLPWRGWAWTSSSKTKREQRALQRVKDYKGFRIFAFYPEAFAGQAAKDVLLGILSSMRCYMVVDQSACIKNPRAKRTKFINEQCHPLAPYRRILDGAPVAEGPEEAFSQFLFLSVHASGHDTWTSFKAEFCEPSYFNEHAVGGYKNLDTLSKRIEAVSFRVAEEDLDLPGKVYKVHPFDLNKEERRIYDEMVHRNLALFKIDPWFEDKVEKDPSILESPDVLLVTLALVKTMRLRQILSGWFPVMPDEDTGETPPPRPISDTPSRLEALGALLEALGDRRALIFASFRADIALLASFLGERGLGYHGGVPPEERTCNKARFKEGEAQFLFGQPRVLGIGHTLTEATDVIFYAQEQSLRFREESEARAHRTGQTKIVQVWDLEARNSIERKMRQKLRSKKDISTVLLNDPESFFLLED